MNTMAPAVKITKPDWAVRIKALRLHLKKSRPEFAKTLGLPIETLVLWERGTDEPSASLYVILGNLAGEPSCWYFWRQAHLYRDDLLPIMPDVRLRQRKQEPGDLQFVRAGVRRLFSTPRLHAIPLLRLNAAAYGQEGDKEIDFGETPAEGLIAAPSHWAPNPAFTHCLRVRGESMAPVLRDGFIIAIDTSEADLKRLENQMVVAWHSKKGITVCWLRVVGGQRTLVPESAAYGSTTLSGDSGWRVLAKVLWWIGKTHV